MAMFLGQGELECLWLLDPCTVLVRPLSLELVEACGAL